MVMLGTINLRMNKLITGGDSLRSSDITLPSWSSRKINEIMMYFCGLKIKELFNIWDIHSDSYTIFGYFLLDSDTAY